MAARSSSAHAAYAAAALLCAFALLSSGARADCGGFALTCSDIKLSAKGVLTASCENGNGGSDNASLDLNSFISNNNGNLVDGAGFAASCQNIRYFVLSTDDQGVAAECTKGDGTLGGTTTFNVEARVSNNGGTLQFNSC